MLGEGGAKKGEGDSVLLGGVLAGAVSESVLGRKSGVKSPVLFGKKKKKGKEEGGGKDKSKEGK